MNKIKTLLLGGLLTTSLAACAVNAEQPVQTNDSAANKTIKQDTLTIEQMEKYIKEADMVLIRLQEKIDSKGTNPEKRFEARRKYKLIKNSRDEMQQRLNEMRKNTIMFNASRDSR